MDFRHIFAMTASGWFLRCAVLLSVAGCLFAQDVNAPFTGTVNIVLANANGIVVLTDSNQSSRDPNGRPFTSSLPAQKLFRIDNSTVCTIAGFGSTPLPNFPEFTNSAAGVLDEYVEELRSRGGSHSFHEKLSSLYFLFQFQLEGIGNLQHLSDRQIGDYEFELILAGYDLDGTARVGKIVLSTTLRPNGIFSSVLRQATEQVVGRELMHEEAGVGAAAVRNILDHPTQLSDDPDITTYAASKASDHGSKLTIAQLEGLAEALARHSSIVNTHFLGFDGGRAVNWQPVGGANQIAILEGGSTASIRQPSFPTREVNTKKFGMIIGLTLDANGVPGAVLINPPPGMIELFLKNRFLGGLVRLDNAYYFEDDFRNAEFYYDGGILALDPSNRLTDCILTLGPHVERRSVAVQELITRFPWKSVHDSRSR